MHLATVVQAVAMFVATNIDDLVVFMVFFGRARGDVSATLRVVAGQYVGFLAILVVSVLGALGAQLLPDTAIAYFRLIPLALGLRAAWSAWRRRDDDDEDWEVGGRIDVGFRRSLQSRSPTVATTSACTSPSSRSPAPLAFRST